MGMDRREFAKAATLVGAGFTVTAGLVARGRLAQATGDPAGSETVRRLPVLDELHPQPNEDPLLRMQRDLIKAMAKPAEQRKWVMVIDLRRCVGCHACTIGCVAENKLPPGVVYRPVVTEESGEFPNLNLKFTPRPCMQCEKPPCVPVCPVKATWRRPDGVTVIDYDKCIGCRYCLTACPYGARTSDFGEYYARDAAVGADGQTVSGPRPPWEDQPNHEYAKSWRRQGHSSPMGNARKCHFCLHRLEAGELPMCVTTCIGRATWFGDANDPDALVTELIAKHNVFTLLPHKGTHPRVFYIA